MQESVLETTVSSCYPCHGSPRSRQCPLPPPPQGPTMLLSHSFQAWAHLLLDPSLELARGSSLPWVRGSQRLSNRRQQRSTRLLSVPEAGLVPWWSSVGKPACGFLTYKQGAAQRGGWGPTLSLKLYAFSICTQITGATGGHRNTHPIRRPSSAFISDVPLDQLPRFWEPQWLTLRGLGLQPNVLDCTMWTEGWFICAHLWSVSVRGESCQKNKGKFHDIFLLFQRRRQHNKDELFFSSLFRKKDLDLLKLEKWELNASWIRIFWAICDCLLCTSSLSDS